MRKERIKERESVCVNCKIERKKCKTEKERRERERENEHVMRKWVLPALHSLHFTFSEKKFQSLPSRPRGNKIQRDPKTDLC